MKLKKYEGNPILSPNPKNVWEEKCVLNPAVIYDEKNEKFVMLTVRRATTSVTRSSSDLQRARTAFILRETATCPLSRARMRRQTADALRIPA